MSSTRYCIRPENDDDYNYYKMIEDDLYFRPLECFSKRQIGNFRVHGKYVSNFHSGRLPNEYYCFTNEAMKLRSGKTLNYVQKNFFWEDAHDLLDNFDGTARGRCFHAKKAIWFYENYYHLLSTCYQLRNLYDMSLQKLKEFVADMERSVKGVYLERALTEKTMDDGEMVCEVDYSEPMPVRDTEGKYVFCNCRYVAVENGKAIDQEGHHADEFLPQLRKLLKMYQKPHRIIKESAAYKVMDRRLNDDCMGTVLSFIKAGDLKE